MKSIRRMSVVALLVVAVAGVAPCARTLAQERGSQPAEQDPSEGSKDVDQTVPYPMARVLDAAKQAAVTVGCEIKKERPDYLECTRSRHVGVFVGSGGEKVTMELTPKDGGTRVVVKTGKGFVGRLGKKNFSTPIFNETLRLLQQS